MVDMAGELNVLDGSTFFVSDLRGDALGARAHGLFHHDTRFLSKFKIEIDGKTPFVLSAYEIDYYSASIFMAPEDPGFDAAPGLSIIRHRFVGDGLHEDLILLNDSEQDAAVDIKMIFDADFADLFEVKEGRIHKKGKLTSSAGDGLLRFTYERDDYFRQTLITITEPAVIEGGIARLTVRIPPGQRWQTCIMVSLVEGKREIVNPRYACHAFGDARPQLGVSMDEWIAGSPSLESDWDVINHTFRKSIVDLAALCFRIMPEEREKPPAAGLPWFMTLFGRDSLITAYQGMIMGGGMAESALRVLARRQAASRDDFHDSEPGKILHELRFGELTYFGETPHSPYYGSVDATVLFLILLHEDYLWRGSFDLLRELEAPARAALEWISEYGDRDGDGYVEYQTRSSRGLVNQGWKDSFNSIQFADGRLARPPIAVAEVQGYVFDAWMRLSRVVGRAWGDEKLAAGLKARAVALKDAFNRDFWLDEQNFFALALDGAKRRVDSAASNAGQLLWSGIVEEKKAAAVADRLMQPDMWSGWGIRTMSTASRGFSPIGYHNGTVWPHDNSLIAAGLRRYGFMDEAARVAVSCLEASPFFGYRFPEAFAGYGRGETVNPVRYPTACLPQAWSTAAPLLFVRTLMGIEPDPLRRELNARPILPPAIGRLLLRGVNAFGKRWDIEAAHGSAEIRVWKEG